MYGIFTHIYPVNDPNVGKYTIHGAYGYIYIYTIYGLCYKSVVNGMMIAVTALTGISGTNECHVHFTNTSQI